VTASSIGANAVLSDTLVGYAVGGGVEMKLSQHVSARLEALHYGFGDSTMQAPQGTLRIDPDVTTVRAGLTFHWN
jgi:opacity protein-like surface antigen